MCMCQLYNGFLTEINIFVIVFVYVSCASLSTSYRFDLAMGMA